MADEWIRNVSALNDEQLKQEIDLVHQSSIKAFARALAKVRRPEVDTHTLRNGTLTEHDFADTINLLLSIGVTAINSKSAHSHTTLALTWTSTFLKSLEWQSYIPQHIDVRMTLLPSRLYKQIVRRLPNQSFDSKNRSTSSLRYHLVEILAHKLLIFNSVSLLVKTWPLWTLFR
jgi:hypothetical protein